jgi:hypothetical protein
MSTIADLAGPERIHGENAQTMSSGPQERRDSRTMARRWPAAIH